MGLKDFYVNPLVMVPIVPGRGVVELLGHYIDRCITKQLISAKKTSLGISVICHGLSKLRLFVPSALPIFLLLMCTTCLVEIVFQQCRCKVHGVYCTYST